MVRRMVSCGWAQGGGGGGGDGAGDPVEPGLGGSGKEFGFYLTNSRRMQKGEQHGPPCVLGR